MTSIRTHRRLALAGLVIAAGSLLGAGAAAAGGDTTAPKPGAPTLVACAVLDAKGAPKIVPCPAGDPTAGVTFAPDGTIRDGSGKVVGGSTGR